MANLNSVLPASIQSTFDKDVNAFVLVGTDFDHCVVKVCFPTIEQDGEITVRIGVSFPIVDGELVELSDPDSGVKVEWLNLLSRKVSYETLAEGFLSEEDTFKALDWCEEKAIPSGEEGGEVLRLLPKDDAAFFFNLREVMRPLDNGKLERAKNPVGINKFCLKGFKLFKQNGGFEASWCKENQKVDISNRKRRLEVEEVEEEITI